MKKSVVTSFGLLLAIVAASPDCWAVDVQFDNDGGAGDGLWTTAVNWSNDVAPVLGVDNYFVQDGLTATYGAAAGTSSVRKIVVSDTSDGTLNITGGDLEAAGGGDSFQIGRGCCGATGGGLVDLSGTAILRVTSNGGVGERDKGVLHIGPDASVLSPGVYWAVGNHGPTVDAGLEGNGLIDVEGTFTARDLFIGVNDGTGVLRVRGTGSVTLSPFADGNPLEADIIDFNHHPIFQPNQSGTIHMVGSEATLSARNLTWDHDAASPIANLLQFTADSGGVSPITLTGNANISNNDLLVELNGFPLPIGGTLLLIDAATITGTFASTTLTGSPGIPHRVIYDDVNGNILIQRVPEPSTMLLLGVGLSLAICAKRRASR